MPSLLFLVAHASTAAASGMHPQSPALQLSHRRLHEVDEDGSTEVSDSLEPELPAPQALAQRGLFVPNVPVYKRAPIKHEHAGAQHERMHASASTRAHTTPVSYTHLTLPTKA